MLSYFSPISAWHAVCLFLLTVPVTALDKKCEYPKILSALKANYENGSDLFCNELLATVSTVGTLREDYTYVFYTTFTDTKSTDVVYKYTATTTKERVTSTSYESQKRTPSSFVKPLPSYVQQYPTPSVSKACSCYVGPGATYTQYRNCEQASTTRRVSTTLTETVGVPGAETVTYTGTSTKTKLKHTTAPYPSTCPDADQIDYVASDHSQWERGCRTGLSCYRELDMVKAPTLNACIEKCVDYNTNLGYKQCQAVSYDPRVNECQRINENCYYGHVDGNLDIAILRFLPPQEGPVSNFCSTVSGSTDFPTGK